MKITLIIPTYNEKQNIEVLISQIQKELKKIPHTANILIMDDSSSDGTSEVVRKIQEQQQNVFLQSGKKNGLGNAYVRGMKYALSEFNPDIVVEMDADFSHSPSDLPRLIDELKNFDVVVGSRYTAGSKISKSWGYFRKFNSYIANFFVRHIFNIKTVHDCTGGFRAIRAGFLKKINFEKMNANGYSFQVVLLRDIYRNGARIKEIPVCFQNRKYGESKLGLCEIIEFIYKLTLVRFKLN